MKFLATHIKIFSFDIFAVGHFQNIFMEHDLLLNILMIFAIGEQLIILTHTIYFLLLLQYTRAA